MIPLNTVDGGSSISNRQVMNVRGDYWLHVLAYIPLPLLMGVTIQNKLKIKAINNKNNWIRVIFCSIILAAGLEFFQLLLSYRTFNLNDLAGNTGGVLLGLLALLGISMGKKSRLQVS
jgi:glycopeptide antibiotics resistance protein